MLHARHSMGTDVVAFKSVNPGPHFQTRGIKRSPSTPEEWSVSLRTHNIRHLPTTSLATLQPPPLSAPNPILTSPNPNPDAHGQTAKRLRFTVSDPVVQPSTRVPLYPPPNNHLIPNTIPTAPNLQRIPSHSLSSQMDSSLLSSRGSFTVSFPPQFTSLSVTR